MFIPSKKAVTMMLLTLSLSTVAPVFCAGDAQVKKNESEKVTKISDDQMNKIDNAMPYVGFALIAVVLVAAAVIVYKKAHRSNP